MGLKGQDSQSYKKARKYEFTRKAGRQPLIYVLEVRKATFILCPRNTRKVGSDD